MSNWEKAEQASFDFLLSKYSSHCQCVQQGKSDSTTSDIHMIPENKPEFNVETKMSEAQCCQMVIFPDKENHIFTISSLHKGPINKYTKEIIQHMETNFDKFCNPTKKGVEVDVANDIRTGYVISFFEHLNVKCIIVVDKENKIIVPVHRIGEFLDIKIIYRVKKSGSSHPSKKDFEELQTLLKSTFSKFELSKDGKRTFVIIENNIDKLKIDGENNTYLFKKKEGNKYAVTKLSHTANPNIICNISLKKDAPPGDEAYLNSLIFE